LAPLDTPRNPRSAGARPHSQAFNIELTRKLPLGGVATRPWRVPAAEQALVGKKLTRRSARHAAEVAFVGAKPGHHNAFRIEIGIRAVADALWIAGERAAR